MQNIKLNKCVMYNKNGDYAVVRFFFFSLNSGRNLSWFSSKTVGVIHVSIYKHSSFDEEITVLGHEYRGSLFDWFAELNGLFMLVMVLIAALITMRDGTKSTAYFNIFAICIWLYLRCWNVLTVGMFVFFFICIYIGLLLFKF